MEPTKRFSDRVDDYDRARPGYPPAVVAWFRDRSGIDVPAHLADVGCGTGKLAEIFLHAGYRVTGIEPNEEMRRAGTHLAARYNKFEMRAGKAEALPLNDRSMDAIVVGQAFHWFEQPATHDEFVRVLTPGGWVALVWNDRRTDSTPFLRVYETALLRHSEEYPRIIHKHHAEDDLRAFFDGPWESASFEYSQLLDHAGVMSRLLSSSYVPKTGPAHDALKQEIGEAFSAASIDGMVRMDYDTRVYLGRLS